MSRRQDSPYRSVRRAFNRTALKRVCEMYELDFPDAYPDLEIEIVEKRTTNNFYYYADRGSNILFVAHLDTVVRHERRRTTFAETAAGPVIHSGALDDRLGAYIGLELLPKLGLHHDILLTVGEESGQSTAEFFKPPEGKEYNWIIEFDRGGTDVVMYRYQTGDMSKLVRDSGARVGNGSFTDICELYDLGVKGFNWGTGYQDYHSVRGYAFLEDTYSMVVSYLKFHEANKDTRLEHKKWQSGSGYSSGGGMYGGSGYGLYGGAGVGGGGRGPKGSGASSETKWWEDDDVESEGVRVNGKTYASYEEWWNEAHPDEPVVAGDDYVEGELWAMG